jgi:HAD superfamily hydrolase (TIGR01549 family)
MRITRKPIPGLRAVVFDLDGTLARFGLEPSESLAQALARQTDLPDPSWPKRNFLSEAGYAELVEKVSGERLNGAFFIYGAWAEALKRYLIVNDANPEQAARIVEDYVQARVESVELRPGIQSMLKRFAHFKRGLITNGPSQMQWRKIDKLGLRDEFDAIIVSGDRGIHKPDLVIFQAMTKALHVEPHEVVYVGDSLYDDMMGAKRAGWWAIWFNTGHRQPDPEDAEPDFEISSLDELSDLLIP